MIEKRLGFRDQRRIERACPLDSIKAVQLLNSGRHSISEPGCGRPAGDLEPCFTVSQSLGFQGQVILGDVGPMHVARGFLTVRST